MEWVAVVTGLVVVEYLFFAIRTGLARGRYEIAAPATAGHPRFERTFRVQANTLEQLVAFLPGLWLFAYYVSAPIAALLGVLFLVGRALYYRGYLQEPARRGPGFLIGYAATVVLVLGGLIGALRAAL